MECPYCKEEIKDGAIKCKHCSSNIYHTQYVKPANLIENNDRNDFSFHNLGIWRKIFLLANWTTSGMLVALYAFTYSDSIEVAIVMLLILIPYLIWLTAAVSSRNIKHLHWLAGLTIIPLLNPFAAVVIWGISEVSKRELMYIGS